MIKAMWKYFYFSSFLFKRKVNKDFMQIIKIKMDNIRKSKDFSEEMSKPMTGYKPIDIMNGNAFKKEDFNQILESFQNLNIKQATSMLQEQEKFPSNELEVNMYNKFKYNIFSMQSEAQANDLLKSSLDFLLKNYSRYDPIVIDTQMDYIYSQLYNEAFFSEIKGRLLDELAKAFIIKDNYLVIKGYTLLAKYFNASYQGNTGHFFAVKALNAYKDSGLKDLYLFYQLVTSFNRGTEAKELKKILHKHFGKNEVMAAIIRLLEVQGKYENIEMIDDSIKTFESNGFQNYLYLMAYVLKGATYHSIGREAVAQYFIEQANDKSASNDAKSIHLDQKIIEYYFTSGNFKALYEQTNKLSKFSRKGGLNGHNYKYLSVLSAVFNKEPVLEVKHKLQEYKTINKDLFISNEVMGMIDIILYQFNYAALLKKESELANKGKI